MVRKNREASVIGAPARHGRLRRSSTLRNAARALLTTVLVLAISGVSVAAYAAMTLVNDAEVVDLGGDMAEINAGAQKLDGELTILLVGSDVRGEAINDGEEGELNDVNLLLHVPADHKSATIMSIPRDLMVPIPECTDPETGDVSGPMSEQQINVALQYGGLPCVAKTVAELTGMPVPYAAMVDFDGVINISNAIGGVEVCLAAPIVDPNAELDLPAGNVTLQGKEALQFLRTRYGVGDGGDLSRISNQQVFMSALLRQMTSAQTLTNPVKVYSLAKAGVNSLTMSSGMASVGFMQALAGTVANIDLDRINFVQYPAGEHPYDPNKLAPNYEVAAQLIALMQSGEPFDPADPGKGAVKQGEEPPVETPVDENGNPVQQLDENGNPIETPAPTGPPKVEAPGMKASDVTCSSGTQ